MSDWSPERTVGGLRKDAEDAFGALFERLIVNHASSKKDAAERMGVSPKHLRRFFDGARNLPAAWLWLQEASVEVAYLRERALARGYELTPVTSADEHPHDVSAVAKELSEAVVARVDAAAKGTRAAREAARKELREAMQTCAAAINSLDREDAEERSLALVGGGR